MLVTVGADNRSVLAEYSARRVILLVPNYLTGKVGPSNYAEQP